MGSHHFPGDSDGKVLPKVRETQVQSLDQEDSPGEGNGNPPQYSCLGNPMDRGAWRAVVCGVAQESDTTEQLSTHYLLAAPDVGYGVRVSLQLHQAGF